MHEMIFQTKCRVQEAILSRLQYEEGNTEEWSHHFAQYFPFKKHSPLLLPHKT